jgi:hypothetical protein
MNGMFLRSWVTIGVPLCVLIVLLVDSFPVGEELRAQSSEKIIVSPKDKALDPYQYMGSASCNGSACHGSTKPKSKFSIQQNEYWVWFDNDSHAKAYDKLTEPDSQRIAKNLGIEKPEASSRCLVCHAVEVDKAHQGPNYDLKEGVTCEGCHGPAEKWLGPHTRRDWDKKKGAEYGMFDTKALPKRADRCLTCHLGADKNIVDHELVGAGHPRLNFELDNFSTVMPSHWLPPKDKTEREWFGARVWAVGQAVALRSQLELLSSSRKSRGVVWPDLIYFDCYACHHSVVDRVRDISEDEKKLQRWRVREYGGKPGRLVWNAASYTIFREYMREMLSEKAEALDQLVTSFHDRLTGKSNMADFDQTLTKLEQFTGELVPIVEQKRFTQKSVWSLMRRISGDATAIANAGFQSAEQATLALASLYDSYADAAGPPSNGKAIKAAIDGLYDDIKMGRQFDLVKFAQHLTALRGLLEPEAPGAPNKGEPKASPNS